MPEPPADVLASASSTLRLDSPRVAPSAAPARETIAATLDVTALAQEPVSLEEEKEYELLHMELRAVSEEMTRENGHPPSKARALCQHLASRRPRLRREWHPPSQHSANTTPPNG